MWGDCGTPTDQSIYPPGTSVEYYSKSRSEWVPAEIISYDAVSGTYVTKKQPVAYPSTLRLPAACRTPGLDEMSAAAPALPPSVHLPTASTESPDANPTLPGTRFSASVGGSTSYAPCGGAQCCGEACVGPIFVAPPGNCCLTPVMQQGNIFAGPFACGVVFGTTFNSVPSGCPPSPAWQNDWSGSVGVVAPPGVWHPQEAWHQHDSWRHQEVCRPQEVWRQRDVRPAPFQVLPETRTPPVWEWTPESWRSAPGWKPRFDGSRGRAPGEGQTEKNRKRGEQRKGT